MWSFSDIIFGQPDLKNQCRLKSEATERGVESGSTLSATHTQVMYIHHHVLHLTCLNLSFTTLLAYSADDKHDILLISFQNIGVDSSCKLAH